MERNRRPNDMLSPAFADEGSFIDSVMDVLEVAKCGPPATDEEQARAEAELSRQLRAAIGARMRHAA